MDFNKLISKYKENIGEIKDSEELLKIEKYNPWTSENVEDLSSKFLDALENDYRDFSWLNIEEGLFELESNQYKNLHYGIPNHVQGNIDISTLFLCLVILAPTYIYASSNGDNNKNTKNENSEEIDDSATSASYDYTKDEPFTQGFYREKAAFQSDDDYKDYCKNMLFDLLYQ